MRPFRFGYGIFSLIMLFTAAALLMFSVFHYQSAQQSSILTQQYEDHVLSGYAAEEQAVRLRHQIEDMMTQDKEVLLQFFEQHEIQYDEQKNTVSYHTDINEETALYVKLQLYDTTSKCLEWAVKGKEL